MANIKTRLTARKIRKSENFYFKRKRDLWKKADIRVPGGIEYNYLGMFA